MKFTPTTIITLIVTGVVAVATAASPAIQAFWADHSVSGPIVLLVYKTIALLLPSPVEAKKDGAS